MRALGILAGPRKGQVTDKLIDAALRGLKDRGAEIEKLSLYDFNIKPCTGCMACGTTRRCVIDDDQKMLLDKMGRADVVVFGSPTYFCNVTSVAKKFIDRSGPFFTITKFGPKRLEDKPTKAILITACWAPFPFSHLLGVSTAALRAMKVFFGCTKARIKTVTATGVLKFDQKTCGRFLKKAYRIGKSI